MTMMGDGTVMAVFVPGTACGLCGVTMQEGDRVVLLQAFVPNRKDPLFTFSDGAFHENCVHMHPFGGRALEMKELIRKTFADPARRRCPVCSEAILDPDDHFATGYLTSDPDHPLFEFNFLQFHQSHVESWPRTKELRGLLAREVELGQWEGPTPL
jgi:hypothetical protein